MLPSEAVTHGMGLRVVCSVQVLKMVAYAYVSVNDAVAFDDGLLGSFLGSNRNIRIKCATCLTIRFLSGQEFPQRLLKEGLVVVFW